MVFAEFIEISDIPETLISQIISAFHEILANFNFCCDGRPRERDGKSWELCNWDEDYDDDDSVEIKRGDLRNPNSFLLSSFCARRFL
jgi:hypothetical protein